MRPLILVLIFVLAPLMATAQDRLPANPDIQAVIQSQTDAFSTGNVFTAWTFASPSIQQMFGSVQIFSDMVERGYPMVWNPGEVTFLGLRQQGARMVQQVQIVDATGRGHVLDYEMVQIDGAWRISGVTILRDQALGA